MRPCCGRTRAGDSASEGAVLMADAVHHAVGFEQAGASVADSLNRAAQPGQAPIAMGGASPADAAAGGVAAAMSAKIAAASAEVAPRAAPRSRRPRRRRRRAFAPRTRRTPRESRGCGKGWRIHPSRLPGLPLLKLPAGPGRRRGLLRVRFGRLASIRVVLGQRGLRCFRSRRPTSRRRHRHRVCRRVCRTNLIRLTCLSRRSTVCTGPARRACR